jgi:MFS transporter, DHA1 family, inner membrane transport protein
MLQFLASSLPAPPARRVVLLLAGGTFALGTDAFVISGLLPEVGSGLGVGTAAAGLLITIFSATYALSAPVLAVLTGRIERRRLLLFALGSFVVANVLAALAPSYSIMIIARILAALAAAAFTPAANVVAAGIAKPEERGRALATVLGGLTLAGALGVPLGMLVGAVSNWRWTFVLIAVLGTAAAIGIGRALQPIQPTQVPTLRQRATAIMLPGIRPALIVTALAVGGVFTVYTYLAWFAQHVSGTTGAAVTVIYLAYGVAAVVSNLLGGWLVDRYRAKWVAAASIAGIAVAFAVLAVLVGATAGGRLPVAVLCLVIVGWSLIGWWFNPAQNQRLLDLAGDEGQVVLSLSASAIYAGQAIGGIIGAVTLAGGPTVLAVAAAGCTGLSLLILLLTTRHGSPAPAPPTASPLVATPSDSEPQLH